MVTNEQLFLMASIPVLWNALLWALGFAFIERRSAQGTNALSRVEIAAEPNFGGDKMYPVAQGAGPEANDDPG
jgi:hypothetical protein